MILINDFLKDEIVVCLSLSLNSIKVPPLKSTPKLSPLNIKSIMELITKKTDIRLKSL